MSRDMTTPSGSLFLRRTVIGGETAQDDWIVIWNGLTVGRILRRAGAPADQPQWSWGVILSNRPQESWHRGVGDSLDDCKRLFREAWASIKLTDAEVEDLRSRQNRQ